MKQDNIVIITTGTVFLSPFSEPGTMVSILPERNFLWPLEHPLEGGTIISPCLERL